MCWDGGWSSDGLKGFERDNRWIEEGTKDLFVLFRLQSLLEAASGGEEAIARVEGVLWVLGDLPPLPRCPFTAEGFQALHIFPCNFAAVSHHWGKSVAVGDTQPSVPGQKSG